MNGVSTNMLWGLLKHSTSWLNNLRRAGEARKEASKMALRKVITASRETAVYIRHAAECETRDRSVESHLSVLWTDLGFSLQDLGLGKLAKRCQIKGKLWADPEFYDEAFIEKADISLERMERLALEILNEID